MPTSTTHLDAGTFWIAEGERIRLLLALGLLLNVLFLGSEGAASAASEPGLLALRLALVTVFALSVVWPYANVTSARRVLVGCIVTRQILMALTYPYTHDLHSAWTLSCGSLLFAAFLAEISVATQACLAGLSLATLALALVLDAGTAAAPTSLPWEALVSGFVLAGFSVVVRYGAIRTQALLKVRLQSNARFLQSAIDALPSAVAILDTQLHTEVANRAWNRLQASSTDNAATTDDEYFASLERAAADGDPHAQRLSTQLRALTNGAQTNVALTYHRQQANDERWLTVDAVAFEHDGERHIVVVHDDITKIKQAEERARHAEVRFERAVRGSQNGIWEVDLQRASLYCSDVLLQTFGFTRQDLVSDFGRWLDYVHPDDREALQQASRQHLSGQSDRLDCVFRVLRKDGTLAWARITGRCWPDETGRPAILAGSLIDVTAQQRALDALAKSEDQLRTMVESALHGILSIDDQGRVCEFNPAASEALGYTRDEVLGQSIDKFLPQIARSEVCDFVDAMLHPPSSKRIVSQATVHRKDGGQSQVEITCFVGATQDGPRLYTFMHDISEQRRLELAKAEMVATLSHELRTPLTSLRGFSELLLTREFPEARRQRFLGIINEEAERMARLVNDFLDMQRADSRHDPYHLEPVPMASMIAAAVRHLPAGCRSGHPIAVDVPADLPLVSADPEAIVRVLENLLSNACKFSLQDGPIHISCRAYDSTVECSVRDEGIGIPSDEVPRLFERFFRGAATRTLAIGGTGLGLSICKSILHAHHGRIWVESTVGNGTTASFTIPAALAQPMTIAAEASPTEQFVDR